MAIQMTQDQFAHMIQAITQSRTEGSLADCTLKYNGIRDYNIVENFINSVTTYISSKHIQEQNAIRDFGLLLTDTASDWWTGIKSSIRSYEDLKTILRDTFQPPQPNWLLINDIGKDKQDEKETTDTYVTRQMARINRLTNFSLSDNQKIDLFYGHLRLKIKKTVNRNDVNTIAALLEKARVTEQHEQETDALKPKKTCGFCHNHGHTESECRKKQKAQSKPPAEKVTINVESKSTGSPRNSFSCYGCGAPNTVRSKCTTCKKVAKPLPENKEFYSLYQEIGTELPNVTCNISNRITSAFLDTCARASIASRELYLHLLDTDHPFEEEMINMKLADGSQSYKLVMRTSTTITIGLRQLPIQFIAIPDAATSKTLIGADFIKSAGIMINLSQDAWCFADKLMTWHLFDYVQSVPNELTHILSEDTDPVHSMPPPSTSAIKISKRQRKKARKMKNYNTVGPFDSSLELQNQTLDTAIEPIPATPYISSSPTTTSIRPPQEVIEDNETPMIQDSVMQEIDYMGQKLSIEDILKKFTNPNFMPAMLSPISSTPEAAKKMEEDQHEIQYYEPIQDTPMLMIDLDLRAEEASNLNRDQKIRLNEFINKHSIIFNEAGPATTKIEHRIETLNHLPVASAPYRLPAPKREALKAEIDKMLKDDIIEESDSPWASNVVMRLKPNGKWRICIDYKRLNEITIADKYPLPIIDDLLQDARGTLYMTTIDLHSGFWQIGLREEDREKTAFITPFGMYQFKRMPFGLKNASATFQRLANNLKNSLPNMKILTYLDDLILISDTFEDHMKELNELFKRLKQFGLRANREKCHFACSEVQYLGHIITQQGIKANPGKIEAIRCRKPPQDLKQLLSFIQTCSWYRRFIKNFAEIIRPLTKLTKKDAKWEWTQIEQNAFNKLKLALCSAPVLQQIDPGKPFIMKTDASAYAIGAVLVQEDGENEHPIEYASRLLTAAERNYSTIEREALAVVWATEKFRGYIEGGVTVVTDHQPLRWLMSIKSPSGRLARWALKLQAYDLRIVYQPGRTNVVADCLSRPPCPESDTDQHNNAQDCTICMLQIDIPSRGANDIREQQLKDEDLAKIINVFESNSQNEEFTRYTTRGYFMNQGVLYRYNQSADEDSEDALLVVPQHEVQRILTEYHDAPTAGHYGVQRTLARISARYTWTGMRKQISSYVDKCKECQKYKAQNLKPAGLIQSTASHQRFETLAMDLFGPLPTSTDGYRHILVVEDLATRWIELFKLKEATAEACAEIMLNEIFMRFGVPRRIVSDNGTQFVSAVTQKLTFCLDIEHILLPVYHPQANPVERRNRNLKHQLAIQVGTNHANWSTQLAAIRFAMNTARNESTGYTPAYLTFGRNLRSREDLRNDFRQIIISENFIPEITPRLLQLTETFQRVRENVEKMQNRNQSQSDANRRPDPGYQPGDRVLIKTHLQSNKDRNFTAKLAPKRDGPYIILQKVGAATYEIASTQDSSKPIGTYHTSDITPFKETDDNTTTVQPTYPLRSRGRPKKQQ